MRSLLEKALPRWGYDVTLVGDAEEAVERFAPRRFDVVLTDLRLPGRSGLELLDQLKQLDPATPVVVMTAFGSIATAVDAVRRGAADFVTKPLELSYLELALRRTLDQKRTTEELERLRPHADEREGLGGLVGRSLPMKQVYSLIDKVGPTQLTVLVLGESGTGKELCARAIHEASPRGGERFQAVNCAAFSETLLESELFGHERGAFTGADKRKQGHFEVAQGGTLFLDEIAESPPSVQAKLLRALQEREIVRVGGTDAIKVDVRIVAATNRDLEAEVKAGRFRQDLYFRLSSFPIRLAPLRERQDDIPVLVEHFLRRDGLDGRPMSMEAMVAMTRYPWPGNVRQLENAIARAAVLAGDGPIGLEHLPPEVLAVDAPAAATAGDGQGGLDAQLLDLPLKEARERFERLYLEALLRRCQGNVSEAARRAGLGRASLHDKINKLGLDPDAFR
ncbi:MAG: sigma-54-dependent Fis family transcriptional regulator [Planctomycetes bacterium]|nr:sigma-54-dependent Fis family transcriptional regulator [Planctomycetota bacterium]